MQCSSRILLFVAACAFLLSIDKSHAQSSLTNGLAAYYRFSGDANDASGNGKNGTAVNVTATSDRYGTAGAAYKFNGSNSYVNLALNRPLTNQTAAITIAGWVRADSIQSGKGLFFHRGNYADIGIRISQSVAMRLEFVTLASSYGGGNDLLLSASAIPLTNWVAFAATYDGAVKRLYINGTLDSFAPYTGILNWDVNFQGETIGGTFTGQADPFNGGIDEIRLYNRALSASEVADLFVSEFSPVSITGQPVSLVVNLTSNATFQVTATGANPLVYQWWLDGVIIPGATNTTMTITNVMPLAVGDYTVVISNHAGSVTSSVASLFVPGVLKGQAAYYALDGNADDASGYGKHGLAVNVTATTDRFGVANAACKFSGSDSYINLLPNRPLTNRTPAVSIAGWFRADVSQAGTGIFFHRSGYADIGIRMAQNFPMRVEFVTLASTYGGNNNLLTSSPIIPVGSWVFFAATYDGSIKRLYINGVLEASGPYTGSLDWNGGFVEGETISGYFPGQAESFNGALDEIRVFKRALTVEEVTQLYGGTPFIAMQPTSIISSVNSNVSFSVAAGGPAPLVYQWRKDGVNLIGATEATLSLMSVQTNQAGNYTVVITNVGGSITSSVATLTVNRLSQSITFPTLPGKRADSGPFVLSATASSGLPVSYVSSLPAVATVSGNTVTLTGVGTTAITASQPGDAMYLAASSVSQSLVVAAVPPTITMSPSEQSFMLGSALTLSVSAGGTGPLFYQWQFNGTDIAGANASTLAFTHLATTNAGAYTVVVTNSVGSVTSAVAQLDFFGDLKTYAGTILAGAVGREFRVDYADVVNVGTTNWLTLTNVTLPFSPYLVIDPTSPGRTQRYYRAVPLP